MKVECGHCGVSFDIKPCHRKAVNCCSKVCRGAYASAHGLIKGGRKFQPKPPQRFEVLGLTVKVWVDSKKFGLTSFIVDIEDWESFNLGQYRFFIVNGYVVYRNPQLRKCRKLHSILMPKLNGFEVDHINRNKLDNTRANLRYTRKLTNNLNKGIISTNKTGVTGVRWDKRSQKWEGFLALKGKNYHRLFETFEAAVEFRKAMETEHFAPYRLQG